eukprot:12397310-Prorocentrum_lima.AAC.1
MDSVGVANALAYSIAGHIRGKNRIKDPQGKERLERHDLHAGRSDAVRGVPGPQNIRKGSRARSQPVLWFVACGD